LLLYPQLWVVYCFVSDFSVSLYIFIHLVFCVISLFEMFTSCRLIVGGSVLVFAWLCLSLPLSFIYYILYILLVAYHFLFASAMFVRLYPKSSVSFSYHLLLELDTTETVRLAKANGWHMASLTTQMSRGRLATGCGIFGALHIC